MIKERHDGRGNQKRKSWRAQKGNLKEEEEGQKEKEGEKVVEECRRNKEPSVDMDVNSFSSADSQRKNTVCFWRGKIKRYKCTKDTRLWQKLLVILTLKHKCFSNVENLTCRKSSSLNSNE